MYLVEVENYLLKLAKKWTLKTQKSQIAILVLNQSSISAVFQIVRFAGDQKTALSGESLYVENRSIFASLPNTGIPQLVRFFGPQQTALLEKPH